MKHLIFSSNSYLKLAFRCLLNDIPSNEAYCIVFVDEFRTLRQLIQFLKEMKVGNKHRVYLLTGNGINSHLLSPVAAFDLQEPLNVMYNYLRYQCRCSCEDILEHINALYVLSMLNARERQIIFALKTHSNIVSVARRLGLDCKTVYSRARSANKKLGLSGLTELILFARNEFSSVPAERQQSLAKT